MRKVRKNSATFNFNAKISHKLRKLATVGTNAKTQVVFYLAQLTTSRKYSNKSLGRPALIYVKNDRKF